MVTKCVEAQRQKCDQYWPSDREPVFYGDLQVNIVNEDLSCSTWTVRELQITMVVASRPSVNNFIDFCLNFIVSPLACDLKTH